MSDKYSDAICEQAEESPQQSGAILDFDELMLLRSIHGKLDGYRTFRRQPATARAGEPASRLDLDLRLIW